MFQRLSVCELGDFRKIPGYGYIYILMKIVDTTDYIKTPALFTPFTIVHFYSGIIGFYCS